MTITDIIDYVRGLGGVLVLSPTEGSAHPEISWGDTFFYYAPDGEVPTTTQPFATIVTKNYPGDDRSRLDRPGAFRVNIAVGRRALRDHATPEGDPSVPDVVHAHPLYAPAGWLAVVDPADRTADTVRELLRTAHDRARSRYDRHA
ncbi:DUF6194 family protein [Nocardia sp. AG03]|uniref:DUF6194 family protein n=1 Tax=Nocardia sp. AG03 TaxID=3025312 RepID=UPI002418B8AC|nr:DUF6194 family protein [Nocardia sp. AG03]